MKLDFENYPLNIYNYEDCKCLLQSVKGEVSTNMLGGQQIGEAILSSFVKKSAGAGLLTLIDDVSIGVRGNQARKCLATLISEQKNRLYGPYSIRREAQINLMATYCVTSYLSSLECGSWGNGVKNIGKSLFGLFSGKNPLETIFESTLEVSQKYYDICQIYHVAFLLNVYHLNHQTESMVKEWVSETLCQDYNGESNFCGKKRISLFCDLQDKSLQDNLKNHMSYLIDNTRNIDGLYNPFIKSQLEE